MEFDLRQAACVRAAPKSPPPPPLVDEISELEVDVNNNEGNNNNSKLGAQLLSIDPTICRAEERLCEVDDEPEEEQSDIGEEQEEEQSANEDFSSTNSSFGPMSISVQRADDDAKPDANAEKANDQRDENQDEEVEDKEEEEEEEERNDSTCSSSVLTVISNNHLGEQGGRASWRACQHHQSAASHEEVQTADEAAETESNIGVAFESLQFEDEVKSARQEQVDEELLLMGSPGQLASRKEQQQQQQQQRAAASISTATNNCQPIRATNGNNKFSLERVKSACNFITSAISDATKQIDNHLLSANNERDADQLKCLRASDKDSISSSPLPLADDRAQDHQVHSARLARQQIDNDVAREEPAASSASVLLSPQAPGVNLASMFEANVQREIERFESNSTLARKSQFGAGSCLLAAIAPTNKQHANGDCEAKRTEWKIAEEIRYFNEREEELKRRMAASGASVAEQPPTRPLDSQLESVVRCGKLLHIPRISAQPANNPVPHDYQLGRSLKLTTIVSSGLEQQKQQATTISMHRFVASSGGGAKRFVHKTSVEPLDETLNRRRPLAKSMSNLSSLSATGSSGVQSSSSSSSASSSSSSSSASSSSSSAGGRAPDYRAIDSFKSREVPNVQAGLTRRTIETFSRLNGSQLVASSSSVHKHAEIVATNSSFTQLPAMNSNSSGGSANNVFLPPIATRQSTSTAERKIQEELRDIRAREAELESQRKRRQQETDVKLRQVVAQEDTSDDADANCLTRDAAGNVQDHNVGSQNAAQARFVAQPVVSASQSHVLPGHSGRGARKQATNGHDRTLDEQRCSSGDSLYPIKQTIESFRKLTASSDPAPGSQTDGGLKVFSINRVIYKR